MLLISFMEKEIVAHSSILAWEIPWTEEPGGLQSMGRQESDPTELFHFIVLSPEVWEGDASCFVLFPQDCFGISGSLMVPYKF